MQTYHSYSCDVPSLSENMSELNAETILSQSTVPSGEVLFWCDEVLHCICRVKVHSGYDSGVKCFTSMEVTQQTNPDYMTPRF